MLAARRPSKPRPTRQRNGIAVERKGGGLRRLSFRFSAPFPLCKSLLKSSLDKSRNLFEQPVKLRIPECQIFS